MKKENLLLVLLGSNVGNKSENIKSSVKEISKEFGKILCCSSIYLSQSWGFDGPVFYNQVVGLKTDRSAFVCLEKTQAIEKKLGREEKTIAGDYQNRIIDIDLLFLGDQIINSDGLVIPHPKIPERMFALIPLGQIMPQYRHPIIGKTIATLISECKDTSSVKKLYE